MAEQPAAELRYKAFLSYSHKDAAAAGKLHRRLEGYRLPKRLVGRETERGRVPERLVPIFRDREELAASSDLSETVRAALAESEALIVLCSPNAATSLWVSEEIATFRRLHPGRPVLAAILAGDPPGCFPTALRSQDADGSWHEPLATDLRREADGAHLGLLKLVAGITGIALDDLVQRDAQRKIRRVTAVTAGALVALLIMAALTVLALSARREAERQRAEAEGLIEFMLTDLRERLRGVGSLDVMTAVNQRALAHYETLDPSRISSDSLLRRARILHAMGEDYVTRGNLHAARLPFIQAHRATTEQLAREPNDAATIFAHAQSEYWIGHLFELHRDWARARRQYRLYAAAAERLIAIDPQNSTYMTEVAWGALNLGIVDLNGARNPVAAQAAFERAVHWFDAVARADPNANAAIRNQANAYGWLADTYYMREMWRESLAARRKQHHFTEQLYRADPGNVETAYRLAIAERSVARLSEHLGDQITSSTFFRKAHERALWLAVRDPQNSEWLLFRAKVECELVERPRIPIGVSRAVLRRNVVAARSILRSQRNPRVSEIEPCPSRIMSAASR